MSGRVKILIVFGLALGIIASRPAGAFERLVPDFQVSQNGLEALSAARVAVFQNHNFIFSWDDFFCNEDPLGYSCYATTIYGRIVDAQGNPLGNELILEQSCPYLLFSNVATDQNNNFLLSWVEDCWNIQIFARRFDSLGNALGNAFRVDQSELYRDIIGPDLAADGNNNWIIVWAEEGGDHIYQIYARRFDAAGNPLGDQFEVNQTLADTYFPRISINLNNDFMVVWMANSHIFMRRFDANGNPLSDDTQVDTAPGGNIYLRISDIVSDSNNNFIISWRDNRRFLYWESPCDIYVRRFDGNGNPLGNDFRVDQHAENNAYWIPASLAVDPNNNFMVTWNYNNNYWNDLETQIYARRYNAAGAPLGNPFRVDQCPSLGQCIGPAIAGAPNPNFIVAWRDHRNSVYDTYATIWGEAGADGDGDGLPDDDDDGGGGCFPIAGGSYSGLLSMLPVLILSGGRSFRKFQRLGKRGFGVRS